MRSIRKESPTTTDKYIMTTALEATEKDFERDATSTPLANGGD